MKDDDYPVLFSWADQFAPTLGEGLRTECRMLGTVIDLVKECSHGPDNNPEDNLRAAHFSLTGVRARFNWYLIAKPKGAKVIDHLIDLERPTLRKEDQLDAKTADLKGTFDNLGERIAKALSIIEACYLAYSSPRSPLREDREGSDEPNFDDALSVVTEIVQSVENALQKIIEEHPEGKKRSIFLL